MLKANQKRVKLVGVSTFLVCLLLLLLLKLYGGGRLAQPADGDTLKPLVPKKFPGKISHLPPLIGEPAQKYGKIDREAEIKQHHDSNQMAAKKIDALPVDKEAENKDLTTEQGSEFDPAKEYTAILAMSPVVIFSKSYCGFSARLKQLLKQYYEFNPEVTIVELDNHKNGADLQAYIGDKSGRRTVPNMFVSGSSRGGCDDIVKLHESGQLLQKLREWGGKHVKVDKNPGP